MKLRVGKKPQKEESKAKKPVKEKPLDTKKTRSKIEDIVKSINKKLNGKGKICTGADVDDIEFRMDRTGIPAYDYVFNGGLIKGVASNIWGLDGGGKTTVCARIVSNYQRRGRACALAAIENFDKNWWRLHGCYIPYNKRELAAFPAEERKKAQKYNAVHEARGTVPLTLLVHKDSMKVLDMVVAAVRSNVFDLVVVDSLGFVMPINSEQDNSVSDASYGGVANEMKQFSGQITAALNYKFDESGAYSEVGTVDNDTTLLCINQARVSIGTMAYAIHKKYHPPGGNSLRHLWSQQAFQYAPSSSDDGSETLRLDGRQVKSVHSKVFRVIGTKVRGGPEQRQAEIELCVKQYKDETGKLWRPGEMNTEKSLRAIATLLGVVETRGASNTFRGETYRGKLLLEQRLRDDPDLFEQMYTDMIEAARKEALTGVIPEVS